MQDKKFIVLAVAGAIVAILAFAFWSTNKAQDPTPAVQKAQDLGKQGAQSGKIRLAVSKQRLKINDFASFQVLDEHNQTLTGYELIINGKDLIKQDKDRIFALREGNVSIQARLAGRLRSNALDLEIYDEINGYVLPPEPDKKLNNSTLLGIDSNGNGIRDDVERYIIKRYAKEEFPLARTAIALQTAWAEQKIIENPVIEMAKHQDDAINCERVWFDHKLKDWNAKIAKIKDENESYKEIAAKVRWESKYDVVTDPSLNAKIYNTKERLYRNFDFNEACSGHVFKLEKAKAEHCKIDVTKFDE